METRKGTDSANHSNFEDPTLWITQSSTAVAPRAPRGALLRADLPAVHLVISSIGHTFNSLFYHLKHIRLRRRQRLRSRRTLLNYARTFPVSFRAGKRGLGTFLTPPLLSACRFILRSISNPPISRFFLRQTHQHSSLGSCRGNSASAPSKILSSAFLPRDNFYSITLALQ